MEMACLSRIPDEVLVSEILTRLPATCVLRLRSVCRSWRRLTTEPSFIRAHTVRTRRHAAAVEPVVYQTNGVGPGLHLVKLDAHDDANTVSALDIGSIPTDPSASESILRLLASCDGLLCFHPAKGELEPMPHYVCNPVTRTWTTVAATTRLDAASLERKSTYYRYLCGFYFHRPTGKYRLLHYSTTLVTSDQSQSFLEGAYEVATVGGNGESWRIVYELVIAGGWDYPAEDEYDGAEALARFVLREPGSIQVNGSLHWLHSLTSGDRLGVAVFDTESEKFSRMSAPWYSGMQNGINRQKVRLSKICGNLCFGGITEESEGETMELWMLKDYAAQQWVKLHTIQPDRHGFVRTVRPRGGGIGDEEEEGGGELMVRWGVDSFGLYNFKLKTYKPVEIPFGLRQIMFFYSCHPIYCTESLVDPRTSLLS